MLNLVSDSSCDLISGELNSPYARLTVAPMCLHVGGQDYLDTPEVARESSTKIFFSGCSARTRSLAAMAAL